MFPNEPCVTITTRHESSKGNFRNDCYRLGRQPTMPVFSCGYVSDGEVHYEFSDTSGDATAILSELQDAQERMAGRRIHISEPVVLLPGLCGRDRLHVRGSWRTRLLARRSESHEVGAAAWQAAIRCARPGWGVKRLSR